jgi:hypothetical protein
MTKQSRKGWVYFIGPEAILHRHDSQVVKIGFTRLEPTKRLSALQCGSPVALSLIAYFHGSERLEAALHQAFAHLRSHGEWFFLCESLRDLIAGFGDSALGEKFVSPKAMHQSIARCADHLLPLFSLRNPA